jgi:hypothetical protein
MVSYLGPRDSRASELAMVSFSSILADARRARWSLDDVAARVRDIDFQRRFLPDALVHVDALDFLGPGDRRILNQIRAHSYLRLFAVVERFILPFAVVHAGEALHRSHEELLALMQFAEEEAKHIALFEQFSQAFELGFGCFCEIVGPSEDIAGAVLAEDPLAVGLLVLHIEWMTQDHYLRSVKDADEVDPAFSHLLKCHWLEEAQHARIDGLIVEKLARDRSEAERERGLAGYTRLVELLDQGLRRQAELDLEAFRRAGGRLADAQRDRALDQQRAAYEDAFLLAGLQHPRFSALVDKVVGDPARRLPALAARLSASA